MHGGSNRSYDIYIIQNTAIKLAFPYLTLSTRLIFRQIIFKIKPIVLKIINLLTVKYLIFNNLKLIIYKRKPVNYLKKGLYRKGNDMENDNVENLEPDAIKKHKRKEVSMIMRANRLHHSAVDKKLKELNIHRSQHILLINIAHENGLISQKKIAQMLEISPAAVAMSLKKLENSGYITRQVSNEDGRVNHIAITEKGREIIEKSEEIFAYIDNAVLKDIDTESLGIFVDVLEKIQSNLIAIGAEDHRPHRGNPCNDN